MKVLGVTLARGGSKGVPGKHTRDLCGKPVIAWTIEAAMMAEGLTHYVVSSDDPEILDTAHGYGVWTIERPAELAQDTTPTLPALQHAVEWAQALWGLTYDYIVEIRATSPLKTAHDIDLAVYLLTESGADSVIGVCKLADHHPARIKWMENGRLRDWPGTVEPASGRRQDCQPAAYIRNGTIYALKRECVMGPDAKLFGHANSMGMEMSEEASVNIDTELDFKLCQLLMAERLEREHAVCG
jgi:CMP-N,N'-diacetyllegionaminic acid synthase